MLHDSEAVLTDALYGTLAFIVLRTLDMRGPWDAEVMVSDMFLPA